MTGRPAAAVLLCCALGAAWQWLTVRYNYGGNRTALFCHGEKYAVPAGLAFEHVYVFKNSGGYDGQSYHYMAHDPLGRTDIGRAVPDPSLRYPRILVPGMAYLLALGRPDWIDGAFFACTLFFLGLGAWWLAVLLERIGIDPLYAALYAVIPAALISLDRMLVDVALTSLALGFAVYVDPERKGKLYVVLAAAALCRETGFLLFAAYGLRLLTERRYRQIAAFATALIPAVVWTFWVRTQLPGGSEMGLSSLMPFRGLAAAILHPRQYAFPAPVVGAIRVTEWLQLAGVVLALALPFFDWRKAAGDPVRSACLLWAGFGITLPPGVYDDPFAGARVLAPLLLFEFLRGRRLPLLLVTPRVWLEMAPQLLGILRGF
jgi:hypothetical protein